VIPLIARKIGIQQHLDDCIGTFWEILKQALQETLSLKNIVREMRGRTARIRAGAFHAGH
jgi:hypothetical protein